MQGLIKFFVFVSVALLLGLAVYQDPGYAQLYYSHYAIETPLWLLIFVIAITFVILHRSLNIVEHVQELPKRWRLWMKQRQLQNKNRNLQSALQMALDSDYSQTAGYFHKLALNPKTVDEQLLTAKIYLFNGQTDKALALLESIDLRHTDIDKKPSVHCYHAKALLAAGREEESLELLQQTNQDYPKHAMVLNELGQLLYNRKSWQALLPVIIRLEQVGTRAIPLHDWKIIVLEKLFLDATFCADLNQLQAYWQQLPKNWRQQSDVLLIYLKSLAKLSEATRAAKLIIKHLKFHWDTKIACLYTELPMENRMEQLKTAEEILEDAPQSAAFLNAIAILCIRCEIWGKAASYLKASLALEMKQNTLLLLAKLAEKTGDQREAYQYYQKAALHLNQLLRQDRPLL